MEDMDKPEKSGLTKSVEQNSYENHFEKLLWGSRYIVILAVVFGILSSFVLFVSGSIEVINVLLECITSTNAGEMHELVLIGVIGAIDFYLIGVVLLIFSFGIYELFISDIDVAKVDGESHNILDVSSLDELKSKIIKVILMVLIVSFFQRILSMHFYTSIDMLFMAISILAISIGVYFIHQH